MANPTLPQADFIEFLGNFEKGIHSGVDPLLLPINQMAFATNVSLRGTFSRPRPPVITRQLVFPNPDPNGVETCVKTGRFQGAGYYRPDQGTSAVPELLMAQISGRLFTFTPQPDDTVVVAEVTKTGDPQSATAPQTWMWQAEKWMIISDGTGTNPLFFDGTTTTRSSWAQPVGQAPTTTTADFIVPAVNSNATVTAGSNTNVTVAVASSANMLVGDVITVKGFGQLVVQSVPGGGTSVILVNVGGATPGAGVPSGTTLTWFHTSTELPPCRMGVYGLGRNWLCLTDGRQFVGSDLNGESSGTQAENYRDAVLHIQDNYYLAGGGNFFVPGSVGTIQAMIFQALLDQQLGQGPLLIVTPTVTFSCVSPVDRNEWTTTQNPVVSEGMIANGGLSQNSTIAVNGDTIMRAVDGIRSLILARREFATWGNTPISFEMNRVLPKDDPALLPFGSAIFFDNRLLMTLDPIALADRGVYHKGLAVLNADPISSIAGKAPSIWEGVWLGPTPFQLVSGIFSRVERAFAFCYNEFTQELELRELLQEEQAINDAVYFDNDETPIFYQFETAALFKDDAHGKRKYKQLYNGEIYVDQMVGRVFFKVQYRPDQWPGWVDWFSWSECSTEKVITNPATANYQPGFKPRMGLGQPSEDPCDPCTDRQLRNGYSFQFRIQITGQCRFLGAKIQAISIPEPEFAPPNCDPACDTVT